MADTITIRPGVVADAAALVELGRAVIPATYGPIDASGHVCVKLVYDHRALDGAYVARRLEEIERTLQGAILDELLQGTAAGAGPKLSLMPPAA